MPAEFRMIVTTHRPFQGYRANQLLCGQIDTGVTLTFLTVDRSGVRLDLLVLPINP
ncbi:hypothetical protein D3C72_2373050 [compost metagenome]